MRDSFKAEHPQMTFGQLSKYTSAMYAQLTPEEKSAWRARAEADKARYILELQSYIPPPGYDSNGDSLLANGRVPHCISEKEYNKLLKMSKQKVRDKLAPKRNLSPYLLYQNAMRDTFKREHPSMTFGQLSKYTSHMYKNLTPEEKLVWEKASEADKQRFGIEMASYTPSPGFDENGMKRLLDLPNFPKKKKGKKYRDPHAPKRAKGSFVMFTDVMRPKILEENPHIKFIEMGHLLGERWRALTLEEKKVFEERARMDKVRFAQEMEAYNAKKNANIANEQPEYHAPAMPLHVMSNHGMGPTEGVVRYEDL
eukprot:CAMPEP_0195511282 /NCGR_PEP_ID=MMETSP0794_2-20130614/3661_1 /TAXON_ID=515487 /ORGANISM="Stephanopyxis turris, Strain CCMP 815" /LENGTH=310 /DNA_ID=CAMNT_0040638849 /DNA_START=193 /DNA_END=1125 /DNA_ORIENTATION=+